MASFITAAISAISASSIGSALVRIIVAYGVSRLINGSIADRQGQQNIDQGIRLQLQPNTTNPIPLLYGSAYYGGNITDARLVNDNKTMWVCLTLSEHTSQNRLSDNAAVDTFVEEVYYNNQLVTFKSDGITIDYVTNSDGTVDDTPRDLVKIYLYKNGSAQPTLPYDFLGGTLPAVAYDLFPGWDSTWAMTNLTFALAQIEYNRDKGITSIPDLRFKVSNTLYKPGDALYDYMTNTISGAALSSEEIDTASLQALNDYADDEVLFFNEDTQQVETLADRYQINGIINPQQNVMQNLQAIAVSTGTFINYDIATGKWGVIINKDETAAAHFDDSNITSGIDVTATTLDGQYNAVEVEFPSRFIQDQMDTIRINLPVEFLNDNEPENVLTMRMSMLNEPAQARELGYIELYQNRLDRVVTFATDYSKINIESGDVITLSNDIYGFDNQTLRVVRVREIETDDGNIGVEITAQEYDSTLYTAGGQPRRPRTPSMPLAGDTSLGIIATPATPLVSTANNNRQPSVLLTGTVPVGVVDRFEFWASTDNWTTYTLLHEEKNANGAPFNSGTTILARAPLEAGSYRFKVRAGNEQAYSEYSLSTDELVWTPVQTTDEVTEDTAFSFGDLLPALGMGALAYFAYKAFEPELLAALSDTALGQLLGIQDPADVAAAIEAAEQAANSFKIVNVGAVSLGAIVDQTLTFRAGDGITIEADDISHEITFTVTGGGGVSSLEALSDTDLTTETPIDGDVLSYDEVNDVWVAKEIIGGTGITIDTSSATGITITATGEADATNAISNIEAGGNTLTAGTTSGTLTFESGIGINIVSNATNNTITINSTCCEGFLSNENDDQGKVTKIQELDNCKQTGTQPGWKKTVVIPGEPSKPANYLYLASAGTWYDDCYKETIDTIIIDDPDELLAMEIGDIRDLPSLADPGVTGQVTWTITTSNVKLRLRKVGENEYIAMKNWINLDGDPVTQNTNFCAVDIADRPLFSTIDYPNGYELATYSMLADLLQTDDNGIRFIYVAAVNAIPATTIEKEYPPRTIITRQPRTCLDEVEAVVALEKIIFKGTISSDVLWLEEAQEIPIGTEIFGTYTSSYLNDTFISSTTIKEVIGPNRYGLNKEYKTLLDSASYVDMYYYKKVKKPVSGKDISTDAAVDYNDPAKQKDYNEATPV